MVWVTVGAKVEIQFKVKPDTFSAAAASIIHLLYLIRSSKVSEEFERSVVILGMPPLE
jgi:hypothetical protein